MAPSQRRHTCNSRVKLGRCNAESHKARPNHAARLRCTHVQFSLSHISVAAVTAQVRLEMALGVQPQDFKWIMVPGRHMHEAKRASKARTSLLI